jgi:hypothetical protein
MCKEMPVIPVNRVVDKKRIIGIKMEGQGGGVVPKNISIRRLGNRFGDLFGDH